MEEREGERPERGGEGDEAAAGDGEALRTAAGSEGPLHALLDPSPGPRRPRGEPCQALRETGVGRDEVGEKMVAEAVPGWSQVAVGGVVDRLETGGGHGGGEDAPRDAEERADEGAVHRPDAGETRKAAAEEEPQEHRLGLVVEVVSGRDIAGAGRPA
jgi:hypothetical protein